MHFPKAEEVQDAVAHTTLETFRGRLTCLKIKQEAFAGSGIQAGAPRVINLILGRIFLGVGVGFADQASTIYSSEMSPPHVRNAFQI